MTLSLELPTDVRPVLLLGPQRLRPTVGPAVRDVLGERQLAAAIVTAGWQERESEDGELREHLASAGIDARNLRLYERGEDVFARDSELLEALTAHGARLAERQALYRLRLAYLLDAARALLARERPRDLPRLREELRTQAIEDVRRLDEQHLRAVLVEEEAAEAELGSPAHGAVRDHRAEVEALLEGADVLMIAGGHVLALLRRLRLFGLGRWLGPAGTLPVVGWSAGAMVLGERIVLFHDSPPQGAGNAEVLQGGLCAFRGVLPLPHARHRLRLTDPVRVSLFARRFRPDLPVAFDEGAHVEFRGARPLLPPGARVLREDGRVEEVQR